ncbi:MAG: hypothetical protein IBX44_03180 [Sulfurospirillum sp.]|nr:hypothetical protein [Sulfurospirillum sp.]
MDDLSNKLKEYGCSSEFIADAIRFEKLYSGNLEDFIDSVEEILIREDDYERDEDEDEDEDDPIYRSDYNYEGNDENIYFEDADGEEEFEDDEEDEEY